MITPRMIEILNYIYSNGKKDVIATPRILKQGGALYERIWKLENLEAITCKRKKGFPTEYTITECGIGILMNNQK